MTERIIVHTREIIVAVASGAVRNDISFFSDAIQMFGHDRSCSLNRNVNQFLLSVATNACN